MMEICIGDKEIGKENRTFIVAELSANHLHEFDLAVKTIKAAKKAGADAVKVQTLTPDTMTIDCNKEYFKIKNGPWKGKTFYELYSETPMPWKWHKKLQKICYDLDMVFFSTPYDKTAVDFLEKLNVPAYKVASFEIVDIPLIKYIASKGKPIIVSTGIATFDEIEEAVQTCRKEKNKQLALLKCTSAYPTPLDEINLKTIPDMKQKFNTVVGLSDHSLYNSVPVAAVSLGAKIIEKHIILDRKLGGPDAEFSMDPEEFKEIVESVRQAEKAVGDVNYKLTEHMKKSRKFARSLFIVKGMKAGETITKENVKSIRPSDGLKPKYFEDVIGKKIKKDVKRGTPLSWDLIKK